MIYGRWRGGGGADASLCCPLSMVCSLLDCELSLAVCALGVSRCEME